jgi:transposase InsO family protein
LLSHERRRVVHFNATEHPTASWTAQQVVDAFPNETAPRWLLRDRDRIYSEAFRRRVAGMGIAEVVTSPMSPWQSPYIERLIGSIRRECLDHVIVINHRHLRRILHTYIGYYHRSRTPYYPKIQPDFLGPKNVWAVGYTRAMVDIFPLQFLLVTWAGWVNRRQLDVICSKRPTNTVFS